MCVLTLLYISSRFNKIHVIVSAYAWWGVSPAVRVKHMQMMTVLFSLHGVSFGVSNVKLSPIRLWSICVFVSLWKKFDHATTFGSFRVSDLSGHTAQMVCAVNCLSGDPSPRSGNFPVGESVKY